MGEFDQEQSSTCRYGITSPISEAGPTEEDKKQTDGLDQCLRLYKIYESDEELNSRMEVLRKINNLVKEWVKQVSLSKVRICVKIFISAIAWLKYNSKFKNLGIALWGAQHIISIEEVYIFELKFRLRLVF